MHRVYAQVNSFLNTPDGNFNTIRSIEQYGWHPIKTATDYNLDNPFLKGDEVRICHWKTKMTRSDNEFSKTIATLADSLGFDSIYAYDHFIPHHGGDMDKNILECITPLTATAAITKRIKIG